MRSHSSASAPKYQQIAVDIASRIASGELAEGEKVFGRSSVAGRYSVSPETARRAFCMLADADVVSTKRGSGMRVISRENAAAFLRKVSEQRDLEAIKDSVVESIERQKEEMERLNVRLSELIDVAEHLKSMNPLASFMIKITSACRFLGKTVQEIQLWQHTGATLVAIKRDGRIIPSPGPCATLMENDTVYYISQELSDRKMRDYLYAGER